MKKVGLFIVGVIAALTLLANLGPMAGLTITLVVMYYAFKRLLKAESNTSKIFWGVIVLVVFAGTASNVPAVIGIASAYLLYVVYKKWNEEKEVVTEESDPFVNFEKQWAELKKQY